MQKISVKAPKDVQLKVGRKKKVDTRTQWSIGFLITLNTNYAAKTDAEATQIGRDMQRIANVLFTENHINDFITYRTPEGRADLIDDVQVEANVEVGGVQGRVHQHISVLIEHRIPPKGVHINRNGVLAFYHHHATTAPVERLPYIDIKAFTNPTTITRYLFKGLATTDAAVPNDNAAKPPNDSAARPSLSLGSS